MRARTVVKNILGILLLLVGLTGFAMIYIVTRSRLNAVANSYNLMIISDILMLVYSLIYFICAICTLSRRSPRRVASVRPFVQLGVFLAIGQLIVSAFNGIVIWHMIVLGVCGVLIPELFFLLLAHIMARR